MDLALAHPVLTPTLWVLGGLITLGIIALIVRAVLVKRGIREPFVVRLITRASDRVISTVKRPITIAVLDEVADVLQTGHYTRNIASALEENRREIKAMVAEKVKADPTAGTALRVLPFHDKMMEVVTETTMRVIFEVLADPRTDELVSDMLRDNLTQIRQAVRARND
jgi:hypothetical protein